MGAKIVATSGENGEGYMSAVVDVDRAFIRINEGLVHYRQAGEARQDRLPVYLVHAGPGSSAGLAPLVRELGRTRYAIAPDTLGNGDSAAPAVDDPTLEYYADSIVRVLDALKLERVDYFGSHTGAHIGIELLIKRPDRVRRAIFDGLGIYPTELRDSMLQHYAPPIVVDQFGSHLNWAWNFVRDQLLHFPYYMRVPQCRLENAMPPPELLHPWVIEVLKAYKTYHLGYAAVFRQNTAEQLRKLSHLQIMLMCSQMDPVHSYLEEAAALLPRARKVSLHREEGVSGRVSAILDFLDGA